MTAFDYHGVALEPFFHLYNLTFLNERCVELAIAHWWIDQQAVPLRSRGLEVGNVLSHYGPRSHPVVDLHEPAAWYQQLASQQVINADVVEYASSLPDHRRYPWVVSLSTIEHTDDPYVSLCALRSLTMPGGVGLVTFPLGIHHQLDDIAVWDSHWARSALFRYVADGEWERFPEWEVVEGPLREHDWPSVVFVGEWSVPL